MLTVLSVSLFVHHLTKNPSHLFFYIRIMSRDSIQREIADFLPVDMPTCSIEAAIASAGLVPLVPESPGLKDQIHTFSEAPHLDCANFVQLS